MSNKKMNVDFTGVAKPESKYEKYLSPGVYELTVTGVEYDESPTKKTPLADVTVVTKEGKHVARFYLTKGALFRLKELMLACGVAEKALEGVLTTEQIDKALIGKKFRGLLGEREYLSNGVVKTTTEFGYENFAQPLNAENPFVYVKEDNIVRLKNLKGAQTNDTSLIGEPEMSAPDTGDLPF